MQRRTKNIGIKFGTDGWRARIAEDFTFDNVRIVAQAIADYINRKRTGLTKTVAVGYDCRFMSDEYARLVASVLAANNIRVFFTDKATPTPAVTFAIKDKGLDGGIIITASHNPPEFNGIKFKTHLATPADETATKDIENFIGVHKIRSEDFDSLKKKGRVRIFDASMAYIKFLKNYANIKSIKTKRPKILLDYMHGAGSGYLESILGDSCCIEAVRDSVNPLFGGVNPEPIPKNLDYSMGYIRKKRFDLGIALDGDADRIGAIRPDGRYITSGQIISLILLHFLTNRKKRATVVKTISGTTLIEKICKRFKLKLIETPVGFKHISAIMLKEKVLIGGEESGGIGLYNYIPERDGILSALVLIEMLSQEKGSIIDIMDEIDATYGRFCYDRLDIAYSYERAKRLLEKLGNNPAPEIAGKAVKHIKRYDGLKFIMEDESWLLFRFSGTESILRVYAESRSEKEVQSLLEEGRLISSKSL